MADRGDLTLSANYIWKDETYSSIFNRFYNLAPSYSQTDIRALWTDREAKNTVIFFVKNVFDQLGYEAATGSLLTNSYYSQTLAGQAANPQVQTAPVLNRSYTLTPPRTFGVELQHRF
jgi:iron complex outermembrane receptor protein